VRDTALQVNKRDAEYKKAMINSMYKSSNIMNTAIKGMDGYSKSFGDKHKDAIQQVKDFMWIYKG
jgi:hypothetical protein